MARPLSCLFVGHHPQHLHYQMCDETALAKQIQREPLLKEGNVWQLRAPAMTTEGDLRVRPGRLVPTLPPGWVMNGQKLENGTAAGSDGPTQAGPPAEGRDERKT